MDKEGRSLFAANYGSGSVTMFPIPEPMGCSGLCDFKQHEAAASTPIARRAAHCVTFDQRASGFSSAISG
jgi:6-phosphogluconolactonase (cycloisomerase 2 family)